MYHNFMTALVQLPLVCESTATVVRTPNDAARVCFDIRDLAQETFFVLLLDAKNNLINRQMVSLGLANAALVHPREVFRLAIGSGADSIVLSHNHPSGDCTPSCEDVRITRQLIDAGKIIGIKVVDHVIVGKKRELGRDYLSFRESGLLAFESVG